jgi:heme A synthase
VLQQRLGEQQVATIHAIAAVTFVVLLAALSLVFAARAQRDGEPDTRRRLYLICAAVIVLAGLWAVLGRTVGVSAYSVHKTYAGEFVAFYAFSISWFVASWDLIRGILEKATPARFTGVAPIRRAVAPEPAESSSTR